MTLIEAAEAILSITKGSPQSAREITDRALKDGLIKSKSLKPWVHLQAAIREHNQKLLQAGKKEKFLLMDGKWTLN